MRKKILSISASDATGIGGIQGDIKTISHIGGLCGSVVTQLLNHRYADTVDLSYPIPSEIILKQIEHFAENIGLDALKIGILASSQAITSIANFVELKTKEIPLVIDPVMVSKNGVFIMEQEAIHDLKRSLLLYAWMLTLNVKEAEVLSGVEINTVEDAKKAAELLMTFGTRSVLIKGHKSFSINPYILSDVFLSEDLGEPLILERKTTDKLIHGVDNALSAALTFALTEGKSLYDAYVFARTYVEKEQENIFEINGYWYLH